MSCSYSVSGVSIALECWLMTKVSCRGGFEPMSDGIFVKIGHCGRLVCF